MLTVKTPYCANDMLVNVSVKLKSNKHQTPLPYLLFSYHVTSCRHVTSSR